MRPRFISPKTNARPRCAERGGSPHGGGKAIDARLAHGETAVLRDGPPEQKRGGVGCCRAPDFVSGATGRLRIS